MDLNPSPLSVSPTKQVMIKEISSQSSLEDHGLDENVGTIAAESLIYHSETSLSTPVSCVVETDHVIVPGFATQGGGFGSFPAESNNHNIRPSMPLEISTESVQVDADLLESVTRELRPHGSIRKPYKPPQCSIYIIPQEIRQHQTEAYEPKIVQIGLYHHHDSEAKEMRDCKWRCFHALLSRHQKQKKRNPSKTKKILTQECLEMIQKKNRHWIESYYSEDERINLVESVLILDCCFILYILLQLPEVDVDDRLWIWKIVKYDLLLLENQIPFFLIYQLREILGTVEDKKVDLIERAVYLFRDIDLCGNIRSLGHEWKHQQPIEFHHLLHLFYLTLLPFYVIQPQQQVQQPEPEPDESAEIHQAWIPCATDLAELGVEFKKRKNCSLLDVNFSRSGITRKGLMEIPPLLIGDHSRDLFCNLIVFEQCYPHTKCHITAYASFMDCIINTEMDIRLLSSIGILTNRMSVDQGLTHFFSRLNSGMHLSSTHRLYLAGLFTDINKLQEDRWSKSWAGFKRAYCSNVWAVFAAIVGVIFFGLTVLQTFYIIFPYYHPK